MAFSPKGAAKSTLRWFALPIVRPLEQVAESTAAIRADMERVRLLREQRKLTLAEERAAIEEGDLCDPAKIKNPSQRFQAYYKLRGWTEDELTAQLGAFKITKRACVIACSLLLLVAVGGLFVLPGVVQLLMAPVILTLASAMLAMAFRYGLLQSQLEERRLHSARDYLARADFFRHVFWG
jgi:hypothetical protein